MMELFHFLRPGWLLLLPLALGLVWVIAQRSDTHRKWRKFMSPHLLEALLVDARQARRVRPLGLLVIVLVTGIVSLAGPTWRQQPSPFTQDTAALVIVLKVTPSMLTEDLAPSRLERTVQKIHDLLARRPGARTALIAYAGSSHLVVPLTRDANIINTFAAALRPEIMPEAGDDPESALALAIKQLVEAGDNGSVVWIGDGITVTQATHMSGQSRPGGAPLLMLGAVELNPDSTEHLELRQAASELNAKLTFITPDERDIDAVTAQVEADFSSVVDETAEGVRWQDGGYWLLFPLVGFALFWFRAGWVVKYQ